MPPLQLRTGSTPGGNKGKQGFVRRFFSRLLPPSVGSTSPRVHKWRALCVFVLCSVALFYRQEISNAAVIMRGQGLEVALLDPARAEAVRHIARRAMFGGFLGEEDFHLPPFEGKEADALRKAGRELADQSLAAPVPEAKQPIKRPRVKWGLSVDTWLPRLGPVGSAASALHLTSFYSRWIIADLSAWGESGISKVPTISPPFPLPPLLF